MFDVCTSGDMVHIDTIFKFLPHTLQHGCIDILQCCNCLCLYHPRMVLSVGRSFAYLARNARYTVTTDLLVWYSNTQKISPPERSFSHYIHSHRLATEMWTVMKNNILGKTFLSCSFYLYRFRKYVSFGYLIINVCIPGVCYVTLCVMVRSVTWICQFVCL
jgi:hypothetical protein